LLISDTAKSPLIELLEEYLGNAAANVEKHRKNTRARIGKVIKECHWQTIKDVTPASFERWRNNNRQLAPKTLNDYLGLTKTLFNWLVKNERLDKNPLHRVMPMPRQVMKPRRAFSDDGFKRLVAIVPDRSKIVYLLAAYTGLRRNELKQLQWGDLKIQDEQAWLAVRASTTKNRKGCNLPLRQEILSDLLAIRPSYAKPTDLMLKRRVPTMDCHRKYLNAIGIDYENENGRLDFHSLRKTFSTNLSKAGVAPRVAMEAMRHSDIRLTMGTYTDAAQLPVLEAIEKLPWLGKEKQVTGKVTAPIVQNGQKPSQNGISGKNLIGYYINDSASICQGSSRIVSCNRAKRLKHHLSERLKWVREGIAGGTQKGRRDWH
jgi:integrase